MAVNFIAARIKSSNPSVILWALLKTQTCLFLRPGCPPSPLFPSHSSAEFRREGRWSSLLPNLHRVNPFRKPSNETDCCLKRESRPAEVVRLLLVTFTEENISGLLTDSFPTGASVPAASTERITSRATWWWPRQVFSKISLPPSILHFLLTVHYGCWLSWQLLFGTSVSYNHFFWGGGGEMDQFGLSSTFRKPTETAWRMKIFKTIAILYKIEEIFDQQVLFCISHSLILTLHTVWKL